MKEKFKAYAIAAYLAADQGAGNMTDLREAASMFDRLASLPDEVPDARETIITGDGSHRFVVDAKYANYYRDAYFAVQARIAEIETKLAYADDAAAKGEAARLAAGGMELRIAELEKQLAEAQHVIDESGKLADWINAARPRIINLMQCYERRIRSLCNSDTELKAEPWRVAEYVSAERLLDEQPVAIVEINAAIKAGQRS